MSEYNSPDYDLYDAMFAMLVVVCTFILYIILDYLFV